MNTIEAQRESDDERNIMSSLSHRECADWFALRLYREGNVSIHEAADTSGSVASLISYHTRWDEQISDIDQRERARSIAAALLAFADRKSEA